MLNTVNLEKHLGELYEGEKTAAEGGFSCKSVTNCFLSFAAVFLAEKDCTAEIKVYLNGVAQEFRDEGSLFMQENFQQLRSRYRFQLMQALTP